MHSRVHRAPEKRLFRVILAFALVLSPIWIPVVVAAATVDLSESIRNGFIFLGCLTGLGLAFVVLRGLIPKGEDR